MNHSETELAAPQKTVVIGVSGGIAAYKSCELVRLFVRAGYPVQVIMTRHALEFVGELTFRTLSGNTVITSLFGQPDSSEVRHVALADRTALFVAAPATADLLAKMACGIADDALSTFAATYFENVLVAPAMNERMWRGPAAQENIRRLKERGVYFCGPVCGELACGTSGDGRMAEPAEIFHAAEKLLA